MKKKPKHVPTEASRSQVSALSAFGIPHDTIGYSIGISDETLRKYYAPELKHGNQLAVAKIANTLFRKALGGDTASVCFYLKTRGKWRETFDLRHSGAEGGPIEYAAAKSKLSDLVARLASSEDETESN